MRLKPASEPLLLTAVIDIARASQWLSTSEPDPQGVQHRALLEALTALCDLKELAPCDLYIWLECVQLGAHDSKALVWSACTEYALYIVP